MAAMPIRIVIACLAAVAALAGAELPALRTEAVNAGSVFYVKNTAQQPLAAWLIELVDYPGSSFTLFQDDASAPVGPGAEMRIPVTNMTVGAAPEYVKITAAVYADGATAGDAGKVALILARRKAVLETSRELVARLEKAKAAGTSKAEVAASLRQWAEGKQPQTRTRRMTAESVAQAASRQTIADAMAKLDSGGMESALAQARSAERGAGGGR